MLGLIDRSPISPTTGCCDRTYWAWKFVDFPRARFQEAVCVMAYLHAADLGDSSYTGNPRLLRWLQDGLQFWCSIQHPDGSLDEAYPWERSLAATAFTTVYVSEALAFLGDDLDAAIAEKTRQTIERAGDWLVHNDETHGFLSNHLAAAAAALHHAHHVTGEQRFRDRARYFVDRILRHQSEEGWYEEYGGADPGYQTHGSFYLARSAELDPDSGLRESLALSLDFLAHFVHPDGSLGGEYASRNTQTYYPAAFEMLAAREATASWIAETMRPSVNSAAAAGMRSTDAFNYFPFLNNLVFAHQACTDADGPGATPRDPTPESGLSWFPQAGIARLRAQRYDAYVGVDKGGVVKVFDREQRRLAFNDCGYIGSFGGGGVVSTQQQHSARVVRAEPDGIAIEGSVFRVSRPVLDPWRFVAFRLFSLTAGRFPGIARWLKRYLVKVLIQRRRELDLSFRRQIEFLPDGVRVSDSLKGSDGERIASLRWCELFTTIHMGSSRYFIPNELEMIDIEGGWERTISPQELVAGVELQREVRFDTSEPGNV